MSDPKNDATPDADPHGRDHDAGLAGADTREEVEKEERFANSREEGVVEKGSYLDDVGDAIASTLGGVAGVGKETDEQIEDERPGRDPKRPDGAGTAS